MERRLTTGCWRLAPSGRRLVAKVNISIAEGPRLGRPQRQFFFDAVEHCPPPAENYGVHHDLVFIDEALRSQLRDNAATPQNRHAGAGFVLELSHFRRQVALE